MKKLILLLALCAPAFAQHTFPALDTTNLWTGQNNLPVSYTVSTLPAAPENGTMAVVTDAKGFTCSAGGGTTLALCKYSTAAAAWQLVGADNLQLSYTVATLPASPATGAVAIVTDANGASCTAGGGTTLVICRYSGTAWQLVSGGGGGGGGNVNGANLTLNQLVCGSGSSNIGVCNLSGDTTTSGTNATTVVSTHLSVPLPVAQGGLGASLSATGGVNQVLQQSSVGGAVTVGQLACANLSNAAASCSTDTTNASNIITGTLLTSLLQSSTIGVNGVTLTLGDTADKLGTLVDANGNSTLTSTATTNAIDFANITNGATGNPGTVTISAAGSDANINLNLVSKGTGLIQCNGVACGGGGPGGVGGSTKQYQINNGGTIAGSSTLTNTVAAGTGTVLATPATDIVPLVAQCLTSGTVNDCFEVYGSGNMTVPASPTTGSSAGGALGGFTYLSEITCVDPLGGETTVSGEVSQAVSANNLLTLTPPTNLSSGCVGWKPYVTSSTTGTETLQTVTSNCTAATGTTATACAVGAVWTEPTSGLVAGTAVPGANTARVRNFWIDVNGGVNFTGNGLVLGSSASTTQGHVDIHGGNTTSLPGYVHLYNNADALGVYISASGTSGQAMITTSAPGADDSTKYIQTASSTATFTNKTIDTAGPNTLKINGNAVSAVTGTGSTVALGTGPTLSAPVVSDHLIITEGSTPAGLAGQEWLFGNSSSHRGGICNQTTCDLFTTPSSTDTFTNKTYDTAGTGNVFKINGTSITSISGNTAKVATAGTISGTSLTCGDGSGNVTTVGCSSGAVAWSGIGNAAANLTLANAGFTTEFDQTSAVNWIHANTTAATATTSQSSPIFKLCGQFWNGANAQDCWTLQALETDNVTNGASTFVIGHSGTTGLVAVQMPTLRLPEGSAPTGVANADLVYGDSTAHRVKVINNNGTAQALATVTSTAIAAGAGTGTCMDGSGNITTSGCASSGGSTVYYWTPTFGAGTGRQFSTSANNVFVYAIPPSAATVSFASLDFSINTIDGTNSSDIGIYGPCAPGAASCSLVCDAGAATYAAATEQTKSCTQVTPITLSAPASGQYYYIATTSAATTAKVNAMSGNFPSPVCAASSTSASGSPGTLPATIAIPAASWTSCSGSVPEISLHN